jgi:NAD+ synthase (glutamine-hydrolysing)
VIPRAILEKPPSAELRPDQKDTDSLPPYEVLDPDSRSLRGALRAPERIAEDTDFRWNSSNR